MCLNIRSYSHEKKVLVIVSEVITGNNYSVGNVSNVLIRELGSGCHSEME